ncbi:MAG: helix-turn-helix domain-containing protein [Solirubrobacterales bacterium]
MAAPTTDLGRRLGAILRRQRQRAGLSQEELGVRAGLHRTAVGQLERGERTPRADSVIRLAGSMGIPAGDLLDGIAWTPGSFNAGDYSVTPTAEVVDQ